MEKTRNCYDSNKIWHIIHNKVYEPGNVLCIVMGLITVPESFVIIALKLILIPTFDICSQMSSTISLK